MNVAEMKRRFKREPRKYTKVHECSFVYFGVLSWFDPGFVAIVSKLRSKPDGTQFMPPLLIAGSAGNDTKPRPVDAKRQRPDTSYPKSDAITDATLAGK
jgi:hypothetical protein